MRAWQGGGPLQSVWPVVGGTVGHGVRRGGLGRAAVPPAVTPAWGEHCSAGPAHQHNSDSQALRQPGGAVPDILLLSTAVLLEVLVSSYWREELLVSYSCCVGLHWNLELKSCFTRRGGLLYVSTLYTVPGWAESGKKEE